MLVRTTRIPTEQLKRAMSGGQSSVYLLSENAFVNPKQAHLTIENRPTWLILSET